MTYSKNTLEMLESMTAFLKDDAVRNYAKVIGIRNGKACITDGFGMLVYESENLGTEEKTLDRRFQASEIKFPQFESILPTGKGTDVNADDICFFASNWKPGRAQEAFLRLLNGETSIVRRAEGEGTFFNPKIIQQFSKLLPKVYHPTSAAIIDDTLVINFGESVRLIVVKVQPNEDSRKTA